MIDDIESKALLEQKEDNEGYSLSDKERSDYRSTVR